MIDKIDPGAYYAPPDLLKRIFAALEAAKLDPAHLSYQDLLAFDQFHIGGADQTRAMARAAGVLSGDRVLDIGCAIGGSARLLAAEYGATVTGLDAVEPFVQVARQLTSRTDLADRVTFVHGAAPTMPFEEKSFDIVWVQLVLMNIPNKETFFGACARLLRPGGTLALLDVVQGDNQGELCFPVLWADRPESSHLLAPQQYEHLLKSTGFSIERRLDYTAPAIAWFDEMRRRRQQLSEVDRALSPALIISGEAGRKSANVRQGLAEGQIGVVELIARCDGKP